MDPLVTVCTPAFNAACTLRRAYVSLTRQTGRWQHIIVDDGSTDDTPLVVAELLRDPRVIATRTVNRGPAAAHNAALDLATGEFIAFLDADDEYLQNHLSAHLAAMAEHPHVDIFWGGIEVVADCPEDLLVPDVAAGFGFISIHDCIAQGTLFARRHVFDTFRFEEDRAVWWHDYDFIARVRKTFKVQRFGEPTYRYYRNSGSSSIDRLKANWPTHPPPLHQPKTAHG